MRISSAVDAPSVKPLTLLKPPDTSVLYIGNATVVRQQAFRDPNPEFVEYVIAIQIRCQLRHNGTAPLAAWSSNKARYDSAAPATDNSTGRCTAWH